MSEKKFVWSENEERYGNEEFDSREEALAVARENEPEGTIWTGMVVRLQLSDGFKSEYALWDMISEEFFEQVGEVAELPSPSKEVWEDFRRRLDEWADAHKLHPRFFRVDEIQEHSSDGTTRT